MDTGVAIYKPRTVIEERRELAKYPAVMEALDPVEQSVFLAAIEKPISDYLDADLIKELGKSLIWIAKDVGFRSTDKSEQEYLVYRIVEILKRYYGTLTLRDFKMAFEMSITGELDEYLPKGRDGQADRGHYQQFNAEYVCKILNAYKKKREFVLRIAYNAKPKGYEQISQEEINELHRMTKADCIHSFEYFKANGCMPSVTPVAEMLYYNLLADSGVVDEIVVTLEDQQAILAKTIYDFANRGMVGDVRRLKDMGAEAEELQHDAFLLARRNALKAAFAKMVADGKEITDYIKF